MVGLEYFIDSALVLAIRGVVVVLDAVVRAARDVFGDEGPLVAQAFAQFENHTFFVLGDGAFIDHGVQVVVPATKHTRELEGRKAYRSLHCLPLRCEVGTVILSLLATRVHY